MSGFRRLMRKIGSGLFTMGVSLRMRDDIHTLFNRELRAGLNYAHNIAPYRRQMTYRRRALGFIGGGERPLCSPSRLVDNSKGHAVGALHLAGSHAGAPLILFRHHLPLPLRHAISHLTTMIFQLRCPRRRRREEAYRHRLRVNDHVDASP